MKPPRPENEEARLEALRAYGVLDSPREPAFDDIARLAAHVCRTPAAIITFIDETRQWCKSQVGLTLVETPRDVAFCAHSILSHDLTVVGDLTRDARFADNPFVCEPPHVRFYAAAPLVVEGGHALGTLAVLDYRPRALDDAQREALRALGAQVVAQLELRRRAERERDDAHERMLRQQAALTELIQHPNLYGGDVSAALRQITRAAADILDVARASIWRYNADRSAIRCVDLYERATAAHSSGAELLAADVPAYFEALSRVDVIDADDARSDPRTREFTASYLEPLGITAMLDASVHLKGELAGVLCHEHVGGVRRWTPDERSFAVAAANLVSLALEGHERRLTQERYGLAARAATDAIWDWDLATGELALHERFRQMFGYRPDQMQQTIDFWQHAIHPDDRERVLRAVDDVLRSGTASWSDEYRFRRGDGTYAAVFDRGYVIRDAAGRAVRMVGALTDITERRRLEAQLRQSQKMEAIGQLAGGVAHDFSNILTVIQGHAALLMSADADATSAEESARQIAEAAGRGAALIRQLLAFSRQQVMEPVPLDLNDVVARITRMLQRVLGEHISLRVEPSPRPPTIRGDASMIEQILLNLAVNARDAMPDGGRLSIGTSVERVSAEAARLHADAAPGVFACLTLSDTGSGIAPEHLPHLFEPFFTTKGVEKGTGLGLATVYGIVRQHQGWIAVESEPGRGATFRTYLPLLDGQSEAFAAAADEKVVRGGAETVLVVEDEAPVRRLARLLLERHGYTVLEAENGAVALDLWARARERIGVVITDLVMPEGISGLELARRVLAERPRTPVIVTSGYSVDVFGKDLTPDARVTFLQKPYQVRQLLQVVRGVLDGR